MKKWLFYFFFLLHTVAFAKTVCLNMIVKNESFAIRRCLESVKEVIDTWVIVDTGSTDGTQQIIQEVLKEIPGELYERPWVHFEHNRNEALALAKQKGDYLLFIDADEFLQFADDFVMPSLGRDCYYITVREEGADYQRIFLVDTRFSWRWEGVVHESLFANDAKSFDLMKGVINISRTGDGARSKDPKKYLKDAALLEGALVKDPYNARYVFYLAQSYRNAGELELALQNYQKRTLLGGWDEEIFWSLYQSACLQEMLHKDSSLVIDSFCKAYEYRPSRAEPLYCLANHYLNRKQYLLGYLTAKQGLSIPVSQDQVFVQTWMYTYGMWITFADCAFMMSKPQEAEQACRTILSMRDIPPEMRKRVEQNLKALAQ